MNKLYATYQKLIHADNKFGRSTINVQYTGQEAADMIKTNILAGKPLMISRFGANELNLLLNYKFIHTGVWGNLSNILKGIPYFYKIKKGIVHNMINSAGFFPTTNSNMEKFYNLSMEDLNEIDILGSWLNHESFLYPYMKPDHVRVRLRDLTPVTNPNAPWTIALKGKRVLVIHPFAETIRSQYTRKNLLFQNPDMLPDFELLTFKAVQSVAGNGENAGFHDWFQALDYMKERIETINFDIAILGCGAYGMPLAAYIKRLGKQAFHLGGETQIMFGIKGKRWEDPSYNYNNLFYNEYWVRPSIFDTPENINKVEDGCYW